MYKSDKALESDGVIQFTFQTGHQVNFFELLIDVRFVCVFLFFCRSPFARV